jgi:hypothetical protein
MSISPADYEKLGQFYLGREYDLATKKAGDSLLLYDSKDLVTHGVVLGMTGSGKTGLCLAAIEEAAMDNIPSIIIDPKGDISNLLLTFPELRAADFRPWINEEDAAKKDLSPEEFAARTAETWKNGLAEWGQGPERIAELRRKTDITIFTPGSRAGIPVSIVNSLQSPSAEMRDDEEAFHDLIESTAVSLTSMVSGTNSQLQQEESLLVATILQDAWRNGSDLTLQTLIHSIQKPPFDKVGIMDLETFLPSKERVKLALKFNNLLASPGFSTWLEGAPLNIEGLLRTDSGKPRISIFSIAHLGESERMFFVSLLLTQILGWMYRQNGTTSLRTLVYMDEIFGYLPPSANPPSKKPLMTLLKQGRAFGVGCLLATQNPVDLDYKALSNIGTWFLGRLQTERDKLRVLDGLEGAAGAQDSKFDRGEMEKLLSGLGNRVFLMNNVHEDHPVLFQVRWAMSYMTGPLTRNQIKNLMDSKRDEFPSNSSKGSTAPDTAAGMPGFGSPPPEVAAGVRPALGAGIVEKFAPPLRNEDGLIYHPHLLRVATVHFATKGGEFSKTIRWINPITEKEVILSQKLPPPLNPEALSSTPVEGIGFAPLPGFAMNAANYKAVEKDFADTLYRDERVDSFFCPALKKASKPGEPEADFRMRLSHEAREARDAAIEKLRANAAKKTSTLQSKRLTAQGQLDRQKAEAQSANMQAGASVLGGILGAVLGRKSGIGTVARSGTSALGKASGAYKQNQDVTHAKAKLDAIDQEIEALNQSLEAELEQLRDSFEPGALVLETVSVKPNRTDINVQAVGLLWIPFDSRGDRAG